MRKKIKDIIREQVESELITKAVINSTDWSDLVDVIRAQYGDTVPLYHATTIEKSKIIDKEGLKLVNGKNYISFSGEPILYLQLGKSDYVSSSRPVLYRLDAPVEFINHCEVDMDNVNISNDKLSKAINTEHIEELPSDIRDAIKYFIWNGFRLDGFEFMVRDISGNGDLFINSKLTKIR